MNFKIFGPFTIPTRSISNRSRWLEDGNIRHFWDLLQEENMDLFKACGCYIFAIKNGKSTKPFYVGKSQKLDFKSEVFTAHKKSIYKEVIPRERGTPVMFFIARTTANGKFSKPSNNHKDIDFLETLLIGDAIRKNSDLCNIKKTKMLVNLKVDSYFNSKKKMNSSESIFSKMMS